VLVIERADNEPLWGTAMVTSSLGSEASGSVGIFIGVAGCFVGTAGCFGDVSVDASQSGMDCRLYARLDFDKAACRVETAGARLLTESC
jgi:hypothetical protein